MRVYPSFEIFMVAVSVAEAAEGNFTWGAELIKCIDPNEDEALRGGLGASLPEPGGG